MQLSFDFAASYAQLSAGTLKLTLKASLDKGRTWTEIWTAKEALFKLTGKGPLLALSRLALPRGVVLDHVMQKGCALTTALRLG